VEASGPVDALKAYVAEVVGCPPERITAARRFPDGNRHAVHRVSYLAEGGGVRDVVVRISLERGPAACADAEREAGVLAAVGGLTAPRLYDFRTATRWFDAPVMCMEFIPGVSSDLGAATPEAMARLGTVVAVLHDQPVAPVGDIASYAQDRLASIGSELTWVRAPLPSAIRARLEAAAETVITSGARPGDDERFTTGEPLALLHGDIGPGNVLWSPDPVLIDWEYTRLGDPADEIAYLFDQNGLSAARRQAFWQGYRARLDSGERLVQIARRVDWWERLTLLGSTLWWVQRWVRRAADTDDPVVPREPAYYLDHVLRRLERLEGLLC
jgi:aminoglycoside phosphotransferase (APT) family kinase protein